MNSELLANNEIGKILTSPNKESSLEMDALAIQTIYEARLHLLKSLHSSVSRKVYFQLEEKITAEKKQLENIFGLEKGQKDNLSRYSFILDNQYFEQKFLS